MSLSTSVLAFFKSRHTKVPSSNYLSQLDVDERIEIRVPAGDKYLQTKSISLNLTFLSSERTWSNIYLLHIVPFAA